MIWPAANDSNANRLRHIVLTLLALAVLAERAALCPLPVRLHLFDILRRAEYAAVALLIDIEDCFSAGALRSASLPGDKDAERSAFIRIAVSFRALAALIAPSCCASANGARIPAPIWQFQRISGMFSRAQSAPCANDTS
jgi:hypothetical protein